MKSPKNWICLFAGFACFGIGIALMVQADLGLGPWDVFHQGFAHRAGITIGTAGVITGAFVLLAWLPLQQKPGFGTVLNVLTIGPICDLGLSFIPLAEGPVQGWAMLLGGVALTGIGSALYLPTKLGAGPRDGLMMGLHRKFNLSIRLARTVVELFALGFGWWLGGKVGVGTLVFALGIGPTIQFMLAVVKRIGLFR